MRRIALAFLLALLCVAPASAQWGARGFGQPGFNNPTIAATYTGPGDIVSGATFWGGLRAYNAAYATGSNPGVDLVDQAGANPITINIKSNGGLDTAAVSTWVTAHSVSTIKVTKLYDQTGGTHHLIQATLANMPVLTLNALGSLPVITFNGTTQYLQASATVTQAQQISMSAVATRTGNTGTINGVVADGTNETPAMNFFNASGFADIRIVAGTLTATETEGSYSAMNSTFNNASSALMINGTDNTGTIGGTQGFNGTPIIGARAFNDNWLTGSIAEAGMWPSGFTNGNRTSINNNQRAYWGF